MPADATVTEGLGTAPTPAPPGGRHRPPARGRAGFRTRGALPYLLILPSLVSMAVLVGYPLVKNVLMSFQQLGLRELVARETIYVGFDNFTTLLSDPFFLTVLRRTFIFTFICVALTMVLGTLIALLLDRLGRGMRMAVSGTLVLAWAMPIITVVVVWQWLFDAQFGIANWLLTTLGFESYENHSWFATGFSTFAIIIAIVVWQATPFVVLVLYAGLLTIPKELYEAARVDGASGWQVFRSVIFPMLRPIFMVVMFLEIIWDFKAFPQVYGVRGGGPGNSTVTLPVYSYLEGIARSNFSIGAAASMITMLSLLAVMFFYIRRMTQMEDIR